MWVNRNIGVNEITKQPNGQALYVIRKNPIISNENKGGQLCLHVIIRDSYDSPGRKELCFYDTNRGHMFPGELKEIFDHGFTFQDDRNGEWILEEVDLDTFKNDPFISAVNRHELAQQFTTTEELWKWYREEFSI